MPPGFETEAGYPSDFQANVRWTSGTTGGTGSGMSKQKPWRNSNQSIPQNDESVFDY